MFGGRVRLDRERQRTKDASSKKKFASAFLKLLKQKTWPSNYFLCKSKRRQFQFLFETTNRSLFFIHSSLSGHQTILCNNCLSLSVSRRWTISFDSRQEFSVNSSHSILKSLKHIQFFLQNFDTNKKSDNLTVGKKGNRATELNCLFYKRRLQ